jgi:hypothetical protein
MLLVVVWMMPLLHKLHNSAFFDRIKKKCFDKLSNMGSKRPTRWIDAIY